jgi:hypothetical protein
MSRIGLPNIYASTIFCDDIRSEVGGKKSLIGVYGDAMVVHENFPLRLPKFGFSIYYVQKKTIFNHEATVRIYLPGDGDSASIEMKITSETAGQIASTPPTPKSAALTHITMSLQFVIAPLEIKEPGPIKVRIERGEDEVAAGRLDVQAAPKPPTPAPAVPANEE